MCIYFFGLGSRKANLEPALVQLLVHCQAFIGFAIYYRCLKLQTGATFVLIIDTQMHRPYFQIAKST